MLLVNIKLKLRAKQQLKCSRTFLKWLKKSSKPRIEFGCDESYDLLRTNKQKAKEFINEENKNTRINMADTNQVQRAIYDELVLWENTEEKTIPDLYSGYWYYSKTPPGCEFSIHCRMKEEYYSLEDNKKYEEILLDPNEISKQYSYLAINIVKMSLDHRHIAYTIDTKGDETYTCYIANISSRKILDIIPNVTNVEWLSDNQTIAYTVPDKLRRPSKVYLHKIGEERSQDKLLFSESNDKYFVDILCTKDKKYFTVHCNSKNTSEIYLMKASNVWTDELKCVKKRVEGIEYYIDHRGSFFYIITNNDNAFNYKLENVNENDLFDNTKKWKVIVEHDKDIKIEDIDLFENYMVLYERKKSFPEIRVFQFNNQNGSILSSHYVPLYSGSSKICSIEPGVNIDFKKKKVRFEYSSPITPTKVYEYNMEKKELNCLIEMKPNGVNHNEDDFVSERFFVPSSKDPSVSIPLTVSYMKEKVTLNGKSPLLLRVYGAYGHNSDAEWKSEEAYLMKHGWIIAIAHVRGGGELGKQWHINGKENMKFNSFYDFMDVVQYLINNSYTSSSLLAAVGHSAGGLVIGASLNLGAGDFIKAVIAKVPFVDVLTAMLDSSLPLTTHEYDEWGDPSDKNIYNYIRSYDPFVNLTSRAYPNILVTASTVDIRVPYWGVLKWVTKMRKVKNDKNLLLLKVDNLGHFGEGGQFSRLNDVAFDYAFLFKSLNITHTPLMINNTQ